MKDFFAVVFSVLPLDKFFSDANFAFCHLGKIFEFILMHFDNIIVCVMIKHYNYPLTSI